MIIHGEYESLIDCINKCVHAIVFESQFRVSMLTGSTTHSLNRYYSA